MNIKNYTTKVPAFRTIGRIEKYLLEMGARNITKNYDENGRAIKIRFGVNTKTGMIQFQLPCEIHKISNRLQELKSDGKIKSISWKLARSSTHAYNLGWRLLQDWIEVQLTLIQIDQVKLEQIFLPYAYDPRSDRTFFEMVEEGNYKLLTGENKNEI
jgi:hypothetical protein